MIRQAEREENGMRKSQATELSTNNTIVLISQSASI